MHTSYPSYQTTLPAIRTAELAAKATTALLVFSGAFVLFEPGPYELLLPVCVLLWMAAGLRLSSHFIAYLCFAVCIFLGGMMSVVLYVPIKDGAIYMITTLFLACSGFIFAAITYTNPEWATKNISRFYIAGAVLTGLGGIAGYFGIGPGEILTKYGRAKGFFQDPNVYSAYLVYPVILIYTILLRGEQKFRLYRLPLFGLLALALLVSFSRGAIAHFALSGLLASYFAFITSHNVQKRLRVLIACTLMLVFALLGAIGALSIPKVAELADERFSTTQSYDVGYEGRFGRHGRGFALALESPFGIGLNNFAKRFTEDPHNTPLKMLMDYGWLGFFGYLCIVLMTMKMAVTNIFKCSAYRDTAIALTATYIGLTGLSMIIDINHWRHFWLITGMIWGLYLVTKKR